MRQSKLEILIFLVLIFFVGVFFVGKVTLAQGTPCSGLAPSDCMANVIRDDCYLDGGECKNCSECDDTSCCISCDSAGYQWYEGSCTNEIIPLYDSQSVVDYGLEVNAEARIIDAQSAGITAVDATTAIPGDESKTCCCEVSRVFNPRCEYSNVPNECPEGMDFQTSNAPCEDDGSIGLQVAIPGEGGPVKTIRDISEYFALVYNWSIGALAIITVVMIMVSGFQWLNAMGNENVVKKSQERIKKAVAGLALAAGSVTLLLLVNPNVISLDKIAIDLITSTRGDSRSSGCPEMIGETYSIEEIESGSLAIPNEKKNEFNTLMRAASEAAGIDCDYLKAIVFTESKNDPNAISPVGAVGLAQLMPCTAVEYGLEVNSDNYETKEGKCVNKKTRDQKRDGDERFDPEKNLRASARYIKDLATDSLTGGDFNLISAGYNGGRKALEPSENCVGMAKWQCLWNDDAHTKPNTGYKETREYVIKTQSYLNYIRSEGLSCNANGPRGRASCDLGRVDSSAGTVVSDSGVNIACYPNSRTANYCGRASAATVLHFYDVPSPSGNEWWDVDDELSGGWGTTIERETTTADKLGFVASYEKQCYKKANGNDDMNRIVTSLSQGIPVVIYYRETRPEKYSNRPYNHIVVLYDYDSVTDSFLFLNNHPDYCELDSLSRQDFLDNPTQESSQPCGGAIFRGIKSSEKETVWW